MLQRLGYGHALARVHLQEPDNEIEGRVGAMAALPLKQGRVVTLLQQLEIGVLLDGVRAHEQGLSHQQVKGAPAEAPRVNLRCAVRLLNMKLGRAERFAHEAPECRRQLLALLVSQKHCRLPWVADFDYVVPGGLVYVEEHVLQGYILHRHFPLVQDCQALGGLPDEELGMQLVKAVRLELQSLQQIAALRKRKNDIEAIRVLEMFLRLHNMFVAPHGLREADLAQGDLAELDGVSFLCLCQLALVQHLHREIAARRQTASLVHATKESTLKMPHELVLLPVAPDIWAHHLGCTRLRCSRARSHGGGPQL
jgi:hypothetical protein